MNFDFSEDQRRLQQELRRVLADHSTSANVRRVLEGEAPFCAATWRELAVQRPSDSIAGIAIRQSRCR